MGLMSFIVLSKSESWRLTSARSSMPSPLPLAVLLLASLLAACSVRAPVNGTSSSHAEPAQQEPQPIFDEKAMAAKAGLSDRKSVV